MGFSNQTNNKSPRPDLAANARTGDAISDIQLDSLTTKPVHGKLIKI